MVGLIDQTFAGPVAERHTSASGAPAPHLAIGAFPAVVFLVARGAWLRHRVAGSRRDTVVDRLDPVGHELAAMSILLGA